MTEMKKRVQWVTWLLVCVMAVGSGAQESSPNAEKPKAPQNLFFESVPTNIVADALRAEKLATERLKWTDEMRGRYAEYLKSAAGKDPSHRIVLERLEGVYEALGPARQRITDYTPTRRFVEENCYAIANLLTHTNEHVRESVIAYYARAREVERKWIANNDFPDKREEIGKGVYDPAWIRSTIDPLALRSLFDRRSNVRRSAKTYCLDMSSWDGVNTLASMARAQGTNEWAMDQWVGLYGIEGVSYDHLIPPELLAEVKREARTRKIQNWVHWYDGGFTNEIPRELREEVRKASEAKKAATAGAKQQGQ